MHLQANSLVIDVVWVPRVAFASRPLQVIRRPPIPLAGPTSLGLLVVGGDGLAVLAAIPGDLGSVGLRHVGCCPVPVLCVDTLSLIHISEPTRLLSISYAVFCLKKKKKKKRNSYSTINTL
eukprot:TRINITY_DN4271_c0_g1_i11.p2 TRINITY_DN4271_c0_g1~~TRINITY_DN4271_c0_g1_i11.p2  ORF type:complete len:121 (+),score=14.95 TRINITY_DN4271_c0_g1_i11:423-785(+)